MSYDNPVGPSPDAAPAQPQYYPYPHTYPYYMPPFRPTNSYAVASLVLAIIGLTSCLLVPCPVAAVMGHVARRQMVKRNEQGAGFALAGIILGWSGTGLLLSVAALLVLDVLLWSRH
ncbi:MAG: hypothetical protein DLM55_01325 [Acidimicrobiales bacterium]|nr:MAG: hypothetical protein DLM55_01325 [Acidimicrobiales bacterium]